MTRGMVGAGHCRDSQMLTSRHDGGRRSAILARDRIVENLKGHGPTPRLVPLGVASRPYWLNWGPASQGARLLTNARCATCDAAHNARRELRKVRLTWRQVLFRGCASDRSRHGLQHSSDERRVVSSRLALSTSVRLQIRTRLAAWFSRRHTDGRNEAAAEVFPPTLNKPGKFGSRQNNLLLKLRIIGIVNLK
jgi:hypothetical protein